MSKRAGYSGSLLRNIMLPDSPRHAQTRKNSPNAPLSSSRSLELSRIEITTQEREKKVLELFKHFELEPDSPDAWRSLAMELAIRHVPGFHARVAMGAPVKATLPVLCNLYRHINRMRADQRRRGLSPTDSAICLQLSKDKTFKATFPALSDCSASRLHNLLIEAKEYRRDRVKFFVQLYAVSNREDAGDAPPWRFEKSEFAERHPKSPPPGA